MTIDEAINIVEEGLIGENSLAVKIRVQREFDKNLYNRIIEAILFLIENFKDKNEVPKKLALCFVDVSNSFYVSEKLFSEKDIIEMEDAGMKLSELANKLFSG